MQEQYYFIGEAAGKIYRRLEQVQMRDASMLMKEIGVSDTALFHQALGWLAREGKVTLAKKGKVWEITLVHASIF